MYLKRTEKEEKVVPKVFIWQKRGYGQGQIPEPRPWARAHSLSRPCHELMTGVAGVLVAIKTHREEGLMHAKSVTTQRSQGGVVWKLEY
ncbi:hypothetical protein TNCV_2618301 [Trichonephila clavipes]|nr:hypothetical protein TNCV_2618301 [Trichonephila clavipes]